MRYACSLCPLYNWGNGDGGKFNDDKVDDNDDSDVSDANGDAEMQKVASVASVLLLFFSPAVLIFGLCMRNLIIQLRLSPVQ